MGMSLGGGFGGIVNPATGVNPLANRTPFGGVIGGMLGGGTMAPQGGAPVTPGLTTPGIAPPGGVGGGVPGSEGFDIESFITNNPQYQFLQTEGLRGLQRTAAAKGMFGSGNLMRDLVGFSSGLASQSYGDEMDRIMAMAGVEAGSPAAAGQTYGEQAAAGTGYGQEAAGAASGLFDLFT